MNRDDTLKVLSMLKIAYPGSYKGFSKEELNAVVNMWHMQFADVNGDIVMMAVNRLIGECKFQPSVAEVKDTIHKLGNEAYVILATTRSLPSEEYKKLSYIMNESKRLKSILSLTRILGIGSDCKEASGIEGVCSR